MELPSYQLLTKLAESEQQLVYRALRNVDGARVLLKRPSSAGPRSARALPPPREFELLQALDLPCTLRPLERLSHQGMDWFVYADPGAAPLTSLLAPQPIPLSWVLEVAHKLAASLAELHRRGVIHKDLQPSNVWLHPTTRELWLDGFAFASREVLENPSPLPPALLQGRLAYASPEQTGRMNRVLDYRTDFYSLGIVLYELLCGARPFLSADPLELIHAHIAKPPVDIRELRAEVPEPLAQIVMKLLEKTAEARYQSALGIKADLEVCAREWSARRAIGPFLLASQDVSDQLLLPQRLYGREREVERLIQSFSLTCDGANVLLLVSGYSGVGKTSLIQELYRPIVAQRGHFIAGKFDQIVRNLPYGALLQAFRALLQQLLTEGEAELARWRQRLLEGLGTNAAVMSEVLPEIELILGPQPSAPALEAAETQNRFRLVLQRFVGALSSPEHPLLLFLDDLQWADAASLELLTPLLTSQHVHSLCVVGAYRDNEVGPSHALNQSVASLPASGVHVERIELGPLDRHDLRQFAVDCLHRRDPEIEALAELLLAKTEGNPFFAIQFLKMLGEEGLIAFDHERGRFQVDLAAIAEAPSTHNVIELMSRRIARLSPDAQRTLTLAACVGNPFEVDTLSIVSERTPSETEASLAEALEQGLILRRPGTAHAAGTALGASLYAFLHDRVQQAAYAELAESSRPAVHLALGRLLLERWSTETIEERLFDVTSHLNLGRALIEDRAERLTLSRLNLKAGKRAKASTAYQAALGYFKAGLELLGQAWDAEYSLSFELSREAAECEYLCGHFAEAERQFETLLGRARSALDKVQVYRLRVIQLENLSRYADATRVGQEGLGLLGVVFPSDNAEKQRALDAELSRIEVLLKGREIASLGELPEPNSAELSATLRLLTEIWAPAYVAGVPLLPALVSATMVRLSIEHGNTEDSAYGYVTHAISVGPSRGDYAAAYAWGMLALDVNTRFDDLKRRAKVHQQFNAHVAFWRSPFANSVHHAREAQKSGLLSGDFTYAAYGAMSEAWPAFLISQNLQEFVRVYQPHAALLESLRTSWLAAAHAVMLNWARALAGQTASPTSLSHESFDEDRALAANQENPIFATLFQIAKLQLAFQAGDYPAALAAADAARQAGWGHGTLWPPVLAFWRGLSLAALSQEQAPERQQRAASDLLATEQMLDLLAQHCPANFRCFALILGASRARLQGDVLSALQRFDEAIADARESGNLQHEALANELVGRLWIERNNQRVGRAYLAEARRAYLAWGAFANVRALDARHPGLGSGGDPSEPSSIDVLSVTKAARALSVEIVLDQLLQKLMAIAIENAGAERGYFICETDGQLFVEAFASVARDSVELLASLPLDTLSELSHAVVRFVHKTHHSLVLGEASSDPRFGSDPYVQRTRPRSIVCVPAAHSGKLGGILYLENNLASFAFTDERLRVLDLLCSQAAISLENARLYRERTQEVERRTRAEEELRAALSEVESLKNRLQAENVYLKEEIQKEHNFEEMVGNSPALRHVLAQVELIAATDSTVLINGETGTGKELIARAIHNRSARRERPLVKVNCGAIAAGLVESELFGHVKGAFTGALERRVGRFELAQGGTIFLDELGELPLDTQVKLLRVLQEQEFEPVGSSTPIRVDVRVIAATNRDLQEAINAGRFRSDLYYRLNVLPLSVPALRERTSDIPLLVAFFLARFSRRFGKTLDSVSKETMERLLEYPWPGNVRELQNVIERAVVLTPDSRLVLDRDLLPVVRRSESPPPAWSPNAGAALEEVERRHILEVLQKTRGVIEGPAGAARVLGLHPNTLRSRMKKLAIRRPQQSS